MRIMKKMLLVALALALVFVVGGFLLPSTTHVERSVVIARPPASIFAMVNSFRRFNEWSPWHARDPKTVYTFEGPESGVGASMAWSSARSDVGKGRQTIIESDADHKVTMKLQFEGQGDAVASFVLTPAAGAGTRVTWGFDVEHGNNLMSRWFGLMFDRMVGPDYQAGLAKLKTVVEAGTQ